MTAALILIFFLGGAALLVAAVVLVYKLLAARGPENRPDVAMRPDELRDPAVAQLEETIRRQRNTMSCLGAALVVVVLGIVGLLVFGYQVLEFLRAMGRGHPG